METTNFDVILLDVMLPGRDGLSVLRQMRARKLNTPVLLLTARGEVTERVEGLNAGADDYLAKPFAIAELVARVRALSRRGGETKSAVLRVGDLTLDTILRQARRGEKVIDLAAREFRLLEYLMRCKGRVCDRMAIVESVWDYDFDPGSNLVDVYVMRLRDKIDARFVSLGEKIEEMKGELLTAGERRARSLHRRINELEAGLARVDERTKK